MSVELVPLCTLRVQLKPPIEVGVGPAGTRRIFEVESVKVDGDRLSGEMAGSASADWGIIGPEGTGTLDVRGTIRTHDGALIFVQYHGRVDESPGQERPMVVYVTPRFETGDERYTWLNPIQAVGKGLVHEDLSLDYEWYELR